MLFHHNSQKAIRIMFGVLAVLIIVSMLLLNFPALLGGGY